MEGSHRKSHQYVGALFKPSAVKLAKVSLAAATDSLPSEMRSATPRIPSESSSSTVLACREPLERFKQDASFFDIFEGLGLQHLVACVRENCLHSILKLSAVSARLAQSAIAPCSLPKSPILRFRSLPGNGLELVQNRSQPNHASKSKCVSPHTHASHPRNA